MLKKSASGVLRRAQTLNVPGGYASVLRHGRLTVSPASTDVALIMLRAADLVAALLDGLFEHPVRPFVIV